LEKPKTMFICLFGTRKDSKFARRRLERTRAGVDSDSDSSIIAKDSDSTPVIVPEDSDSKLVGLGMTRVL